MGRAWNFASFLAVPMFVVLCWAADARAVVLTNLYYACTDMGAPNQSAGVLVGSEQFIGARFNVTDTISITAAGGHMFGIVGNVFGAIVKFTGDLDYPDSANLSTADVLRTFTFTPPPAWFSADITVNFNPLTLTPGEYGVVFGGGLFGATGFGGIPNNADQPPIGSPVFFGWNSDNGWHTDPTSPIGNPRLTVYVPEPSIAWLCGILPLLRRRTHRAHSP